MFCNRMYQNQLLSRPQDLHLYVEWQQFTKKNQTILKVHLNKIGMFCISYGDCGMNIFNKFLFLFVIKGDVPLCKAGLPCTVLDQDKADLK